MVCNMSIGATSRVKLDVSLDMNSNISDELTDSFGFISLSVYNNVFSLLWFFFSSNIKSTNKFSSNHKYRHPVSDLIYSTGNLIVPCVYYEYHVSSQNKALCSSCSFFFFYPKIYETICQFRLHVLITRHFSLLC